MTTTSDTGFQPQLPLFSDEQGYYVRDPKSIQSRTTDQFVAFSQHLVMLCSSVNSLAAGLSPEQQALVEQLKSDLAYVQGDTRLLLALMQEQSAYISQLIKQRRSARESFQNGWDARLQDILSQLHPVDHRMLRWILTHLDAEAHTSDNALPF